MQQEENLQEEQALKTLLRLEDLAEKKIKIFSRLLMDAAIAKDMESLSLRHEQRKEELARLLGKKPKNKQAVTTDNEEEANKQ